jgi:hypothetical protein
VDKILGNRRHRRRQKRPEVDIKLDPSEVYSESQEMDRCGVFVVNEVELLVSSTTLFLIVNVTSITYI